MKEFNLKNGIKSIYKKNKNTPRIAFVFDVYINDSEQLAGTYTLMSRLLLQGTTNRSSEQIANELDESAIELSCDMKQDYLRFRFLALNEDFEKSMEILEDIIKNPTFEEFEKEKVKMLGEITAELDSARTKALDNYYKTIFENHYYGNTYTKILKTLSEITLDDVKKSYKKILNNGKKVIAVVGDIDFDTIEKSLNKHLSSFKNKTDINKSFSAPILKESRKSEVIKSDAQQAQILKGWIVPTFDSIDYPAFILLNIILGASGLSSRLFVNLRDKKGLAYVVRSSYETYEKCGCFSIYIATEPKNIETSLEGFVEEVEKLKKNPVDKVELGNAKNNLMGKQQFILETNAQQANVLAYYGIMNLGFNFQDIIVEKIKNVTAIEVQECCKKYLTDINVISVLRP